MDKRNGSDPGMDLDAPLFAALREKAAGPSPVDIHVGNRVRLRRTLLGLSQEKLADALGVTFQQVQKYERGANRISASRLFEIGRVLEVPPAFFFEEMPGAASPAAFAPAGFAEAQEGFGVPAPASVSGLPNDLLSRKETIDLVRAYYRIEEPAKRRKLLDLIKAMGPD